MGDSLSEQLVQLLSETHPETKAEQTVTVQLRRVVAVFAHLMLTSVFLAWMLTMHVFAAPAAAWLGTGGPEHSASNAWGLLLLPLFLAVFICLLTIVVYARSLQARALSPEETDRLERRAANAFVPLIVASGLVTVFVLMLIGGDIHGTEYTGGEFGSPVTEVPVRTAFHKQLTDIWGLAVAPAAGATGLVAGTIWTFDIRSGLFLGGAGALVALVIYFETVPSAVSALGLA